jgi:hypothetical protein
VNRRRALVVLALSLFTFALHLILVRAMAHGHVAHVLLGSGNAAPPLGAAVLAISLVVVRVGALVVAPGMLLASLASLAAYALVGPPRGGDDHRDGVAEGATGTSSGAGKTSDEAGSGSTGTGFSIEGRAT